MGSYGVLIDGQEVIKKVYPKESSWRNIKPKFDLKDCPKCGAKQSDNKVAVSSFWFDITTEGWTGKDGYVGYCRNCMCRTAFCYTDAEAANKWNEGEVT